MVDNCVAVGITERMSDTLTVFSDALGVQWSGLTPYENASYNRPKVVDAETLAVIRSITQLDAIVYQAATARLAAALAARAAVGARTPTEDKRGPFGLRRDFLARLPERSHRFKLGLSAAICRAPRIVRIPMAGVYMAYRILVDPRASLAGRGVIEEVRLAAMMRFDLGPSSTVRAKQLRHDRLL
jgi:hypothetical protein